MKRDKGRKYSCSQGDDRAVSNAISGAVSNAVSQAIWATRPSCNQSV